ncbi:MAG TPA: DNA alkylation repair protein [Candidatus Woesebacteria bacterium]|nr:DNA alkylation repair protein [Candidatus Woesebacteria bacterium]HNS94917.1 DNA alkylation repair protein [Candidatus Woesebacteria bacterium]
MTSTAKHIRTSLSTYASPEKATVYARFFKTGKGEYGEGDRFLGIMVPDVRKVAKAYYKQVTLNTIQKLIQSPYHEMRLCALVMLVYQYNIADDSSKQQIYTFYLRNTKFINNWDLVDLTAPNIVGDFLLKNISVTEDTYFAQTTGFSRGVRRKQNTVSREKLPIILVELSRSQSLWERRIAILSTFAFIRAGKHQETFALAKRLLHDKHDLIHKAVGWMLREVGKRVDQKLLCAFLDKHADTMPRTMLRYAIEHLTPQKRKYYMHLKNS